MTSLPADHLLRDLTSCERQVWDALVQGDAAADAALLCESFLGVYGTGFAGKADHTGQLEHGPTVQTYELSQLTARALGPEYAVLSYHARFQRCGRLTAEDMYVSSIWQRTDNGWVNIFSQDTAAAT
ncbi:nuclear transport factor 2 family protein [Tritonibacter mobilis]|uniref:nuclear transport factor 2 family protein n=1 Tax=Tritonibacter mobilis TaxID=379347 RepID=UPI000806CB0A|nr:nuclear transport factor 2 family protein [Tritonibacter mobilis]